MGLNAKEAPSSGGDRVEQELLAIDNYPARVVSIIDLGLQPQLAWKGKDKDAIRKVNMTYELSEEFMLDEDGVEQKDKPRWISETMPFHNLKADRAKSTLRYNAIDPHMTCDGEFTELGGMPCTVNIVQNEKNGTTYNNVGNVAGPVNLKGYEQPELVNGPRIFLVDEPDMEVFNDLPEWIQDIIKGNLEYNGSVLQKSLGEKPIAEEKAKTAEPPAPPAPPAPPVPDVPQ